MSAYRSWPNLKRRQSAALNRKRREARRLARQVEEHLDVVTPKSTEAALARLRPRRKAWIRCAPKAVTKSLADLRDALADPKTRLFVIDRSLATGLVALERATRPPSRDEREAAVRRFLEMCDCHPRFIEHVVAVHETGFFGGCLHATVGRLLEQQVRARVGDEQARERLKHAKGLPGGAIPLGTSVQPG